MASGREVDCQGGLMQAQIKIPIPTQRRVLKVGEEMHNCSSEQGHLWQLNTKGFSGNPEIPEFSED